jgi:AcrR family transcriptional regulator
MKNTKDKILRTAQRLFNQRGIESVSIRGIASEMGISHGNLMYHFENKEVLTHALLKTIHVQFQSLVDQNKGVVDQSFLEFCIKNRWVWCGKRELKNMEMYEVLIHFENGERSFWERAKPNTNPEVMIWLTEAWLMRIPIGQKSGFDSYIDSFQHILSELKPKTTKSSKPKTKQATKYKRASKKDEDTNTSQGSLF